MDTASIILKFSDAKGSQEEHRTDMNPWIAVFVVIKATDVARGHVGTTTIETGNLGSKQKFRPDRQRQKWEVCLAEMRWVTLTSVRTSIPKYMTYLPSNFPNIEKVRESRENDGQL